MNTLWFCALLGLVVATMASPNWKQGLREAVADEILEGEGDNEDIVGSFDLIVDLNREEEHALNKFIDSLFKEAEKELKGELKDDGDVEDAAEDIVEAVEEYLLDNDFIAPVPAGPPPKGCKYGC